VSASNTPPPRDGILLFVHGYLDSAEAWRRVIDHLDKSFRSVALDLEPAADSGRPAATLDSYADQVLSKVGGAAGSGRVVIVGHSMGGAIAELAADALEERLAGLILINPAPLSGYQLDPKQAAEFEKRARDPNAAAAARGKRALSLNLDDEAVALLVSSTMRVAPDFAIEQLRAWTGGHPSGDQPSRVRAPLLLVTSDDHFFTHSFLVKAVASRFDAVRVHRINGAGHWPQLEQPLDTARSISRFAVETLGAAAQDRSDRCLARL
jgi:pimeloyl-ACP methyl ester carboxylesterase